MWSCTAPDCQSDLRKKKFFPFPTEEKRRKIWTMRCHLKSVPHSAKICEDHFEKKQFLLGQDVKKLKPDAVPSLFLDFRRKKNTADTNSLYNKKTFQNKLRQEALKNEVFPPLFSNPVKVQTGKNSSKQSELPSIAKQQNKSSIKYPSVSTEVKSKICKGTEKKDQTPVKKDNNLERKSSQFLVKDKMNAICDQPSVNSPAKSPESSSTLDLNYQQSSASPNLTSPSTEKNSIQEAKQLPIKNSEIKKPEVGDLNLEISDDLPEHCSSHLVTDGIQAKCKANPLGGEKSVCIADENSRELLAPLDLVLTSTEKSSVVETKELSTKNCSEIKEPEKDHSSFLSAEQVPAKCDQPSFANVGNQPETFNKKNPGNGIAKAQAIENSLTIAKPEKPNSNVENRNQTDAGSNSVAKVGLSAPSGTFLWDGSVGVASCKKGETEQQTERHPQGTHTLAMPLVAGNCFQLLTEKEVAVVDSSKKASKSPELCAPSSQPLPTSSQLKLPPLAELPSTKTCAKGVICQSSSNSERPATNYLTFTNVNTNKAFILVKTSDSSEFFVREIDESTRKLIEVERTVNKTQFYPSSNSQHILKSGGKIGKTKNIAKKPRTPKRKLNKEAQKSPFNQNSVCNNKKFTNIHNQTFEIVDRNDLPPRLSSGKECARVGRKRTRSPKRKRPLRNCNIKSQKYFCDESDNDSCYIVSSNNETETDIDILPVAPKRKRKSRLSEYGCLSKKSCLSEASKSDETLSDKDRYQLRDSSSMISEDKGATIVLPKQTDGLLADMVKLYQNSIKKLEFPAQISESWIMPNLPMSNINYDDADLTKLVPRMKQWNEVLKTELLSLREKYKNELKKNEVLMETQIQVDMENKKLKQDKLKLRKCIKDMENDIVSNENLITELKLKVSALSYRCCVHLQRIDIPMDHIYKHFPFHGESSETTGNFDVKHLQKKLLKEKEIEFQKKLLKMLKIKNENKKIDMLIKEFESERENEQLKLRIKELENENQTMIEENEGMLEEIEQYIKENKRMNLKISYCEKMNSTLHKKLKTAEMDSEMKSKKIWELKSQLDVLMKRNNENNQQSQVVNIRNRVCSISQ